MTKIYACLIGAWTDLSTDENCKMGPNMTTPTTWWEENAELWSPSNKDEHTMYQQDYIVIHFKNKDYRIHPIFIQIVEE